MMPKMTPSQRYTVRLGNMLVPFKKYGVKKRVFCNIKNEENQQPFDLKESCDLDIPSEGVSHCDCEPRKQGLDKQDDPSHIGLQGVLYLHCRYLSF
jgi:hypothetical protein